MRLENRHLLSNGRSVSPLRQVDTSVLRVGLNADPKQTSKTEILFGQAKGRPLNGNGVHGLSRDANSEKVNDCAQRLTRREQAKKSPESTENEERNAWTESTHALSLALSSTPSTFVGKDGTVKGIPVELSRVQGAELHAAKLTAIRFPELSGSELLRERAISVALDNGVSMRLWTQAGTIGYKVQRAGDVTPSDLKALDYRIQGSGQRQRRDRQDDEVFE